MICALGGLAIGCATVESVQSDPANHRRTIVASAYSLDGCQEKMDELAGGHVEMTGHTQLVIVSVLNLGATPSYVCHGVIADGQASPRDAASSASNTAN